MSRKGENIYKRKDGRWEGRFIKNYDITGKAHYGYVYGKTYSEVRKILREKQSLIGNGSEAKKKETVLYQNILTSWLEAQRINVKESTYARYYHVIYTHISPNIGSTRIDEITTRLIETYVAQLIDSGRIDGNGGLSSKTTGDILTVIKATIEYAKHDNYPIQCDLGRVCIKQQKREMRVLSVEEQQKLTGILMTDTDLIKFGILLSLYTGIRIGEVCALKWSNLNTSTGILSVTETMQRIKDTSNRSISKTKIVLTEPKSKSSVRDIPLPTFLIDIAKGFQNNGNSYLLTGDKNRFIEPRTMQYRFKTLLEKSQIPNVNYHSLRHTFATRCIEVGFDVKTLSEILGHSNVNITLNRYVHSSFELKRKNMGKIICVS